MRRSGSLRISRTALTRRILLPAVIFLLVVVRPCGASNERPDPLAWLGDSRSVLAAVDGYSAIFHKQERIDGDLNPEETILLKFRKPFQVYMKWIRKPHQGRETLYVEGRDGDRIVAHEGGILGVVTVKLDPRGARARKGNRHLITDTGLENLVRLLDANLRRALDAGRLSRRDLGDDEVYGVKTRKMEFVLSDASGTDDYCHRALVWFDPVRKVPLKFQAFDRDGRMLESYSFESLDLHARLTDADFDPANPSYRF